MNNHEIYDSNLAAGQRKVGSVKPYPHESILTENRLTILDWFFIAGSVALVLTVAALAASNVLWLVFLAGSATGTILGLWWATAWIARHDRRSAARLIGLLPQIGIPERPPVIPNPYGKEE